MLTSTPCPEPNVYRQLTSGQLPIEQAESLLQHLETCDVCVAKIRTLPASDTLIEWIRQGKSSPSSEEKPLTPLMQRLIQLGKSAVSSSRLPAGTLTFSCTGCRKALRVKQEVAGKKVKCPHCKQVVLVPAATPEAMETAVLPPASTSESATVANLPASSKEQELCAFLAPSQAPDEIGRLGAYRVLKVLGAGGMGVVFRAEDPQLQRLVALKAMLPALAANESARQRFLREARAAASLKHDHIVTIFQVGEDRGAPFLAMEFLEGEALEDRLKREGQLPLPEVLRIGREIAEGLQAAHEHGLIHRDIKPANVWLEGKRGRAKILDFGLARSSADEVHLTQSGAIVGTPAYMPPEQARGDKVDGRCDLYSLGCVLFRLCTGELPFKADNTMSLLLALATEQPKSPREINADVPPPLADLILRLLAKDPAQRPATASEVAEALGAIDASKPAGGEAAHAAAPPRRRRRLAVAAAAGALLLAGILTIIVIVRNKQGEEIARVNVPKGGSVELKDNEGDQTLPKRPDGREERSAAKIPPPVQIPEPPPLAEWLKGRTILTVSQDGKGQFKTIKAALNALKPHQVVKVLDRGPYRESLAIGALPLDTGLISEQQTVLETPSETEKLLTLGPLEGFRLSGFRILALPSFTQWDVTRWIEPSGLVIENCYFGRKKPEGSVIYLDFGKLEDCKPAVVRDCIFDSGRVYLGSGDGRGYNVVLERNYFKKGTLSPGSVRVQQLVVRHNIFDNSEEGRIWCQELKEVGGILEISNNTLGSRHHALHAFSIIHTAPKGNIVFRNNCSDQTIGFDGEAWADLGDSLKNWQLDHNCYLRRGALPKASSDVLDDPPFLSVDPSHPDYLRIAADGPAAKGGAGGAWPSYIGALPPGPAPKDGDWFTRLRQRWGDVPPTAKPLSPPVQIPEPPPLAEWLKGRKVLTVSQDGKGQFKTIQAALDALKPHQVVKVLDRGPYRESLRLTVVPEDTGLISDQNTIVELAKWESDVGHHFAVVDGFRLSGFRFLSPPHNKLGTLTRWSDAPSGLVIEDCCFDPAEILNPWPTVASIDFSFQGAHLIKEPVVVRRCAIYGHHIVTSGSNSRAVVLIENNYFHKTGCVYCGSPRLGKLVIRNNVFDIVGPHIADLKGDATALELSNNTICGPDSAGMQCVNEVPTGGVTVSNNIMRWGIQFNTAGGAARKSHEARAWRVGHNCYLDFAKNPAPTYPRGATDLVDQAEFLSLDPHAPDYLRLPPDSPLGKAGAGGAWPSYIGALPPGPAPKDGDWFTRLRQRWGNLTTSETLSPGIPPPIPDAWFKEVAALPAEKQVEAVVAKLKERNPGFDGKETHMIDKTVVVELRGLSGRIKDISPVRALTDLRVLTCHDAPLSDLSPLKGMPLTYLDCYHTNVANLSPLKGMPLELLIISSTKVFDLSPLKGMPLTRLECWGTPVSDLSPLKGMPLTFLDCAATPVSDLSPLKDMKLTLLKCIGTKVSDLSPVKSMPLKELGCDFKPERDAAILRSIKTLEEINDKPAAEFWKEVDAKAAKKKP